MSDVFATTTSPFGLTSDGTYLYTTNNSLNTISRFNLSTKLEENTNGFPLFSSLFNNPHGICCVSSCLYIANFGNNNIQKYDLSSQELSTWASVASPYDIVYYPSGHVFFVSEQNQYGGTYKIHIFQPSGVEIYQMITTYKPFGITVVESELYVCAGYIGSTVPYGIIENKINTPTTPTSLKYSTKIDTPSEGDNVFAVKYDGSKYVYSIINNTIAVISVWTYVSTITTMNLALPRGLYYQYPYLYISDNHNNNIRMLNTTNISDIEFSRSLMKNTFTCALPVLNHYYSLSLDTLKKKIVQFLKTKERIISIPLVDPTQTPIGDFIVSLNVAPSSIPNHLSVSGTGSFVFMNDDIRAQIHFFHTIPAKLIRKRLILLVFPELMNVKRGKSVFKKATDSYGIKYNSVDLDTSKIPNHAVFVHIKPMGLRVDISLYLNAYNTSDPTIVAPQKLLSDLPPDSVYRTVLQNLCNDPSQ